MTKEERKLISEELLNNLELTKEQYIETCMLLEELDAELVPDDTFDD